MLLMTVCPLTLHFDMADEFEDMSPIREITELETVYDRLREMLCQACGGLCETNCMSWSDVSQEESIRQLNRRAIDLCENLKPCHMLLNSVGLPSSDMWLLDSGAGVSVVSRDFSQGISTFCC